MPERVSGQPGDVFARPPQSQAMLPPLKLLFRMLSPAGSRARLSIVIFHRVLAQPDPLFPNEAHAVMFAERVRWLRSWFNILPLHEAIAGLARGRLPERALSITFDDGYADNATVAMPILRQHGLHATFFVATGFIDGGTMWNDTIIETVRAARSPLDVSALGLGTREIDTAAARRAAIVEIVAALKYRPAAARPGLAQEIARNAGVAPRTDLMMTSGQLRDLAAGGMGIGAHTVTHPILARLDDATARREMGESRETLSAVVRQPVTLFAYPNGKPDVDYRAVHVAMVKSLGFAAAVSTASGAARVGRTLYELPRFTPWDRTPLRFGMRLMRNLLAADSPEAT